MAEHAYDYDLFVIGAGSGGVRAARMAASFGARVAVAEEYRVGGTCVIRGCVPKKLLVYASHFGEDFADAAGYGWSLPGAPSFDWGRLIAAKDAEIDRLNGLYTKGLKAAGVEIYQARATFVDNHTLDVGGRRITAETILIAVGGRPNLPDLPGIEHAITSNEAFHLRDFPNRVLVCGGGYIAVEFAGIFNGLGAQTTLAYRKDKILRGFDEDLRDRLTRIMTAQGVDIRTHAVVERIDKSADGLDVTLSDGTSLQVDQVMFAIGRQPHVAGLGLDRAGVATAETGAIEVDDYSQTNVDNIYAVGDVTDRIQLTPVAIKEGHAFALTKYKGERTSADHTHVASAVFSQPPIATVGLTEDEAISKLGRCDVYTSDFKPMRNTLAGRDERAFAKAIVDPDTDRVIGLHMIGPEAPEIMQGLAVAVKMGLTKAQLDATVAIHPSSAEEFVLMREKRPDR
ncbi:glutathione-disulfide reductase [Rhodothalassium salexigens]|uniref:glutathione-disulfide reductase n=1 Tax=Rhodothalassium salexigens TaxID=1086 RepID=UPI001912668E|nr:glutathione-disulfide reductase [Rhodothalassium salexigens]MBK5910227.1 glutathione-disulfide reductase [Rhodothalassium salexigens]MBK5920568.1 glutathione-disulfide reductase [Rhodothalassium salexigens]